MTWSPTSMPAPTLAVRILLIEDDEVDVELVRRLLPRGGIDAETVAAPDGPSGFAALSRGAFDLVLLDYELPGRDGLYVLKELRAEHPLLPVIMLTGREETELAVDMMRSGAADYLSKHNLTPQRLAQSVRHALRLKHAEIAARAADEARASIEEFNRRLLAHTRDCVKVLDAEGRLLSMNEGGQRAMGITDIRPHIGRSWLDFWRDADREAAAAAVSAAASGQTGRMSGCARSAAGTTRGWEVVVAPVPDGSGAIRRLIAISRDLGVPTARAELEQEVAELKAAITRDGDDRDELLSRVERIERALTRVVG